MTNWVAMPATKKMHVRCRPGSILVFALYIGIYSPRVPLEVLYLSASLAVEIYALAV